MMTVECNACRSRYSVESEGPFNDMSCPDCGTGVLQPERDQPPGTTSDGRLRNMVDPASGKDMGGNPLQEGILGQTDRGWQNRMKRDESFASVRTASTEEVTPGELGLHNKVIGILNQIPTILINGEPLNERTSAMLYNKYARQDSPHFREPVTVSTYHPVFTALARRVIEDSHGIQSVYNDDVQAINQAIKAGEIPHPSTAIQHTGSIYLDQTIETPWYAMDFEDPFARTALAPAAVLVPAGVTTARTLSKPLLKKVLKGALAKGLGKGAKGLLGAARGALAIHGIKSLLDGGDKPTGGGGPVGPRPITQVTHVHADVKTPTSQDEIPGAKSGDPEDVDTKEFNDESHDVDVENPNNDEAIGTDTPSGAMAHELLPLLLTYYDSEDSGMDDPLVTELVELLSQEHPDLLDEHDDDDDHSDVSSLIEALHHEHTKKQSNMPWGHPGTPGAHTQMMPGNAVVPNPMAPAAGPNPAATRCPNCGGTLNPDSTCPQCGFGAVPPQQGTTPDQVNQATTPTVTARRLAVDMRGDSYDLPSGGEADYYHCPNCGGQMRTDTGECYKCGYTYPYDGGEVLDGHGDPQAWARDMGVPSMNADWGPRRQGKTADSQGPANPEQFKAVSEMLIEMGRAEEIPHMFEAPWEYADLLAQIQNDQNPPPEAVEQPAVPPPPPMPPGMDPSMMQGAPPGMAPTASIEAAVARFSADNIAPKCPQCGSHSTGILTDDGTCRCHACNNAWNVKAQKTAEREPPSLPEDHATMDAGLSDPADAHPADHGDEVGQTWATPDGTPLEEGHQYEMHSDKYSIPDIIEVSELKPSELVFKIVSDDPALEDINTISVQEAQTEGLSFVPVETGEAGQNTDEYLDDVADADRANTTPTPAAAKPFTSSTREAALPVPGMVKNHFKRIMQEQGPDAAIEWLMNNTQHWPDATQEDRQGLVDQEAPTSHDHTLEWQPGSRGRGLIADGKLHTWPVDPTPDNPQGGLMHGEKMQEIGAREFQNGFEIGPDGTMEEGGVPLDNHMEFINSIEPRLKKGGPKEDMFTFGSNQGVEGADWLLEGASTPGMVPAPWEKPLEDLTGGPIEQQIEAAVEQADADWLVADMPNIKSAGAKFSPQEQKAFINENGEARNLDKLDLEDTHYTNFRQTDVQVPGGAYRPAQPDLVPEDDFALGF